MPRPSLDKTEFVSLEPLEPRIMLTASQHGGTLHIVGTDGNDYIEVFPSHIRRGSVAVWEGSGETIGFEDVKRINIRSLDGNDTINLNGRIYALVGYDDKRMSIHVNGGAGEDMIFGSDNADIIRGGSESDTIQGHDGDDKIYGGTGDDSLDSGEGDDILVGGTGNDSLFGGFGYNEPGQDKLNGGPGDDSLHGGLQGDFFSNETSSGEWGITGVGFNDDAIDLLRGGAGTDTIYHYSDTDILQDNDPSDLITDGSPG